MTLALALRHLRELGGYRPWEQFAQSAQSRSGSDSNVAYEIDTPASLVEALTAQGFVASISDRSAFSLPVPMSGAPSPGVSDLCEAETRVFVHAGISRATTGDHRHEMGVYDPCAASGSSGRLSRKETA